MHNSISGTEAADRLAIRELIEAYEHCADRRDALRGGTHLLLLEVDPLVGEDVAESVTGQFHKRLSERYDLMIKGKGLNELKKYRLELISRGIAAGEIPDEMFFGHHLFCIKDPDGNGITIYSSHAI